MALYARPARGMGSRFDAPAAQFAARTLQEFPGMVEAAQQRYGRRGETSPTPPALEGGPPDTPPAPPTMPSSSEIVALYDRLKANPGDTAPEELARLEGIVDGLR